MNDVTCNICLGITGSQSEPLANDSKIDKGLTFVTQLDSQREIRSFKGNHQLFDTFSIFFVYLKFQSENTLI